MKMWDEMERNFPSTNKISHEEVLNDILGNTCPRVVGPYEGLAEDERKFVYDLHCAKVYITARIIKDENSVRYEILDYSIKP